MPEQIEVTQELLEEVQGCCHNGHGAAIFADGSVMQAINSNDVIAHGRPSGGWEYRIAYVDDPDVSLDRLQQIFDQVE